MMIYFPPLPDEFPDRPCLLCAVGTARRQLITSRWSWGEVNGYPRLRAIIAPMCATCAGTADDHVSAIATNLRAFFQEHETTDHFQRLILRAAMLERGYHLETQPPPSKSFGELLGGGRIVSITSTFPQSR